MWICSCLILHNFIVEIEEHLGIASSGKEFYKELTEQDMVEDDTENEEEEDGQDFHNTLMGHLLCILDQ
jgi:hypothetical protein